MKSSFYATDTSFYHAMGAYPLEARCEITKELGFDATNLTLWSDEAWKEVPQLATVKQKYDLDVAGVYVTYDFSKPDNDPANQKILTLIETLEGCSTIEMAIKSSDATFKNSDPAHDATVCRWLNRCLEAAQRRHIRILLYPHILYWLERIEDSLRICHHIKHPMLGTAMSMFHWYAVDAKALMAKLEAAIPYLHSIHICGARWTNASPIPATVEPLDEGDLDNFVILGLVRKSGYQGNIGLQGFSVGGDVYAKLRRSINAFRDIEKRLDAHPSWATLRTR